MPSWTYTHAQPRYFNWINCSLALVLLVYLALQISSEVTSKLDTTATGLSLVSLESGNKGETEDSEELIPIQSGPVIAESVRTFSICIRGLVLPLISQHSIRAPPTQVIH